MHRVQAKRKPCHAGRGRLLRCLSPACTLFKPLSLVAMPLVSCTDSSAATKRWLQGGTAVVIRYTSELPAGSAGERGACCRDPTTSRFVPHRGDRRASASELCPPARIARERARCVPRRPRRRSRAPRCPARDEPLKLDPCLNVAKVTREKPIQTRIANSAARMCPARAMMKVHVLQYTVRMNSSNSRPTLRRELQTRIRWRVELISGANCYRYGIVLLKSIA
jgi:hypothetical protein